MKAETERMNHVNRKNMETTIAQILIAALEAMGTLLLFAKITNTTIDQWGVGGTFLLYLLFLILYVLVIRWMKF